MNPTAYRIEILRQKYEEAFDEAEHHRREGESLAASRYYRRAADVLETLSDAEGIDRGDETTRLTRAADILERGDDLEPHFKRNQLGAARERDDQREHAPADADGEIHRQMESFIRKTDTTWADIGGLEPIKQTLKEAVALGAIRRKPRAVSAADRILLFGPPGTGKTLLASAVSGSLDANFFHVELGNLLSKWYGESSKQISALFETAADLSPSVVFLDEVDAITQTRTDDMHGASRRVLDTLLAELDGIEKSRDEFVLTLAATNTPWDLDTAVRSRFPQRIHVPVPDRVAAAEIVRIHTVDGGVEFDDTQGWFADTDAAQRSVTSPEDAVADRCIERGFTGRDIEALCREAVNRMIDRHNPHLAELVDQSVERLADLELRTGPILSADIDHAFRTTAPALSDRDIERFYRWDEEYGTSVVEVCSHKS